MFFCFLFHSFDVHFRWCRQKINIVRLCKSSGNVGCELMSFGTSKVFSGVQEALILALMLVSVFAVLYLDMGIMYKVGIVAIVFTMIFLMTLATQILREQKEKIKQQQT